MKGLTININDDFSKYSASYFIKYRSTCSDSLFHMIEYNMFKNLTYNSSVPVYAYLMEVTIMKKKANLSLTLDADLIVILRKNAEKEYRTLSNYLNHYLRQYLMDPYEKPYNWDYEEEPYDWDDEEELPFR